MDLDRKTLLNNSRKPEGEAGRLLLERMNGFNHAKLAQWGFAFLEINKDDDALDIGCGGGANLERLLNMTGGRVAGVDHSDESVKMSLSHNEDAVAGGRCAVTEGNVISLPFPDKSFDIATAFETVYFWPDMKKAFSEVFRVLKPGGRFMITNESNGRDDNIIELSEIIDGMSLYTAEDLSALYSETGFTDIRVYSATENPWICLIGYKPQK